MIEAKKSDPLGRPMNRVDGRAKVTGQARYAAEAPIKNVAHAVILQSTIALGEIVEMDSSAAEAAPGVLAILTPKNMPKVSPPQGGIGAENRLPLSDMKVHYAGQHIAVAIADTIERARYAASLIKVKYASTKPVIELNDPAVEIERPERNFGSPLQLQRGNVEQALTEPGLTVVRQTYTTPVETHNPMELSATVAIWEAADRLTVWNATQDIGGTKDAMASAFGLQPANVRVLCPFVGGGFGCKGVQWPYALLAAVAAKAVNRPVKLMLTRPQMFTSCGHRPPTEQEMALAANKDGKLLALRHLSVVHGSKAGSYTESCGMGTSRVLYDTPNLDMQHTVHKVDVAMPTFMRAPGESPGTFALESAMDELSYAVGMDPVALRLANHADKDPDSGLPWSSKHLKECYSTGAEKFGWAKRNPQPSSMRSKDGRPVGWGMATALYPAIRFPGSARIRLYADGGKVKAVGAAATHDLGTGTYTIGVQMTASLTGLPVEQVKFELGDSLLPRSGVSGGSATAGSLAQALSDSSLSLRGELLKLITDGPLAGLKPDQVSLQGSRLVAGDKSENVAALIAKSGKEFIEGVSLPPGQVAPVNSGGEDYNANQRKYAFQSFGAHFVEVTIDDPVPMVRVTRVVSVIDIGRVLNYKTAESQVIGGVVMGIGMALLEDTVYDTNTARPVTNSLADYPVCVNSDIHVIEPYFVDIPDEHFNALGCRGVGEIGITGIAAAVANAVYHATGKRIRDLPITPDKLL